MGLLLALVMCLSLTACGSRSIFRCNAYIPYISPYAFRRFLNISAAAVLPFKSEELYFLIECQRLILPLRL